MKICAKSFRILSSTIQAEAYILDQPPLRQLCQFHRMRAQQKLTHSNKIITHDTLCGMATKFYICINHKKSNILIFEIQTIKKALEN